MEDSLPKPFQVSISGLARKLPEIREFTIF
jgi:hypothetical protein